MQAKYEIVSNYLKEQIRSGFLTNRIPSELDLSKMFQVSRMTVRKGIEQLVAENILYQIPRLGTFVVEQTDKIQVHLEETLTFQRKQQNVKSIVNNFQIIPSTEQHQQLFGISSSDTVYVFSRIRYKNQNVFAYEQGIVPTKFLSITRDILEHSLTDYFHSQGLVIGRIEKEFKAILPNKEIVEIFNNSNKTAVFCIDFSRYLVTGELLEFITVHYNQQQCKFIQIVENENS